MYMVSVLGVGVHVMCTWHVCVYTWCVCLCGVRCVLENVGMWALVCVGMCEGFSI